MEKCLHERVQVTVQHRLHVARLAYRLFASVDDACALVLGQLVRREHVASDLAPPRDISLLARDALQLRLALHSLRLAEAQRVERKAKLERIAGEKRDVAWGSQIRSYVLAPYQLAKDERTRVIDGREQPICETGNVQAVLDGDLDAFVEAFLHWRRQRSGDVT